jgi:hypothetical protein
MRAVRRADQPLRNGVPHRPHTAAITTARDDIEPLAERLRHSGPHDPRAIARVRVLLTDGSGPLHNSRRDPQGPAPRDPRSRHPLAPPSPNAGRRRASAGYQTP